MSSALDQPTGRPHPQPHRRSSQSQPSLVSASDATSAPLAPDPADAPLLFLPSTAYTKQEPVQPPWQQPPPPSAAPSSQEQGHEHGNLAAAADSDGLARDPHDFYRPYQDLFGHGPSLSLHLEALGADEEAGRAGQKADSRRGRGIRSASSSQQLALATQHYPNKATAGEDGGRASRSRKTSFRDLVARFDSPEGARLPPTLPQVSSAAASSAPSADSSHKAGHPTSNTAQAQPHYIAKQRRPLFGELVAPGNDSATPGYGIVKATGRRGSEGSPMHSPTSAMFGQRRPSAAMSHAAEAPLAAADAATSTASTGREPALLSPEQTRPLRRRAHSDMAGTLSQVDPADPAADSAATGTTTGTTTTATATSNSSRGHGHGRNTSGSRIPVSAGRAGAAAATGPSVAHSAAHSAASASSSPASLPRPKHASPKRKPQPLTSIHSPGRHGRARLLTPNGDKSPSLRAKIIAPPPKVSPQLRSSRPRLPVSAASTASSRAKIAEKIQAMARGQHDARLASARRPRPPELSDVDLKARRLRITQALIRSLDGPDLTALPHPPHPRPGSSRAGSRSRKSSLGSAASFRQPTPTPPPPPISANMVAAESFNKNKSNIATAATAAATATTTTTATTSPTANDNNTSNSNNNNNNHNPADNDGDVFITPEEEPFGRHDPFAQHALSAMQGQHSFSADGDSPTLGMEERTMQKLSPPRLNTLLQVRHVGGGSGDDTAGLSAVTHDTVDTTATTFDPEEQVSVAEPAPARTNDVRPDLSLLKSISSLREQTSESSRSNLSNPSSADRPLSDLADLESVNIILRNTTYLDDEEAVVKGYRPFLPSAPPVPAIPSAYAASATTARAPSWTDPRRRHQPQQQQHHHHHHQHIQTVARDDVDADADGDSDGRSEAHDDSNSASDQADHHAATDAYTIVNIFVQHLSASGVVDQQLVDDLYQRVVGQQPDLAHAESVDARQVEELCIRELDQLDCEWRDMIEDGSQPYGLVAPSSARPTSYSSLERDTPQPTSPAATNHSGISPALPAEDAFPRPAFRTHNYKSSLDSVEDWADTSPSVGDWMKYAAGNDDDDADNINDDDANRRSRPLPSSLSRELRQDDGHVGAAATAVAAAAADRQPHRVGPPLDPVGLPAIRPPSHSPPLPPPLAKMASIGQITRDSTPSSFQSPLTEPPVIPPRLGSASQPAAAAAKDPRLSSSSYSLRTSITQGTVVAAAAATATAITTATTTSTTTTTTTTAAAPENATQEQKRLKQRRHVLKELVDTEYTYERDLRVLCDIYRQTAAAALTDEDVKVLFGNIEQVQTFARNFLTYLKQTAKPAYVMERSNPSRAHSTATAPPDRRSEPAAAAAATAELSDLEKDRLTRLGQAFMGSIHEMEAVYTEYIRTRHAANKRFEQVSANKAVSQWLKECRSNSSDITNAWSLDALLVKPVQRITKYPLLLNELIASTPADHPDLAHLSQAALEITEVNVRINEVKKHTELVDQVMNRKRKESDVRNGLTKAWGRRAEKLKQHVGINETYEDGEFARLKMDFDNNGIHLFIVSKDCQGYIEAVRAWVNRMVEIAAGAEAWVDIGHSNNPIAESKLRQLAMAVRGISTIALPDHVDAVTKKVIAPMEKCKVVLERFAFEPKGLIQKREKKLLDYSQAKNKKDRGERLDRRMMERMEQWEAINHETKQRMRKLRESTANLVLACLGVLTHLHAEWLALVQKKLAAAMAIAPDRAINSADIERDWQADFDFYEATVLSLGICNGSLRNEAANLFSSAASSTLGGSGGGGGGEDSWASKRSASLNGDSAHLARTSSDTPSTSSFRHSAQHTTSTAAATHHHHHHHHHHHYQPDHGPDSPSFGAISRMRAASSASGRVPVASRTSAGGAPPLPKPLAFSRPGTSVSQYNGDSNGGGPPRVSLDVPSPSLYQPQRPGSSQTYFSAVPTPNTSAPNSAGLPTTVTTTTTTAQQKAANSTVLYTVASLYEFSIDRSRQEAGLPYLTYAVGEIFDVVGEKGELWMARNQDDPSQTLGWIWCKHFAMLGE